MRGKIKMVSVLIAVVFIISALSSSTGQNIALAAITSFSTTSIKPTANSSIGVVSPARVYDSDANTTYATWKTSGNIATYYGFKSGIPADATITNIAVTLNGRTNSGTKAQSVDVSISFNGGRSFTASQNYSYNKITIVALTKQFPQNLSASSLNSNLQIKVVRNTGTTRIYDLSAVITYTRQTYTINYNSNGGGTAPVDKTEYYAGDKLILPGAVDMSKIGYSFGSWNTAANGTGTAYSAGAEFTMPAGGATLYAQWIVDLHTLTYNSNGGSGTMNLRTAAEGTLFSLDANAFSRTGYSFSGWNTAADGTGTAYADKASFTMPAGGAALYAQWIPELQTLSYNANGGSGTMTSKTSGTGTVFNLDANSFTRSGYSFSGWNTAANGSGTAYADKTSFTMPAGGAALYAQWIVDLHTLTYNSNGGSGIMNPRTAAEGTVFNLDANAFSRAGYSFSGWNTAANGSGTAYADKASFTMHAGGATIYAQWFLNTSTNVAAGILATSSSTFSNLSLVTDIDKNTSKYADSYPNTGIQWIQLDLEISYNITNIKIWHYYGDSRKYHDVIVQLSNDVNFTSGVITVYNNDQDETSRLGKGTDTEYLETSAGLNIPVPSVYARYARFYSNGSTANDWSHYVELEVYTLDKVIYPTSVSLNMSSLALTIGSSDTLTATVLPVDAIKNVTWSSSSPSIASVSSNGIVTGVSSGTAVITAKTVYGGKTASCNVTVKGTEVAKLLFTFDDRPKCDITIAAPILYEKGFAATAYVTKNMISFPWSSESMTMSDLQTLYSYYGWDLGNHSANHIYLSSNDPSYVKTYTQEYLEGQNWLISNGWTRAAYHLAYVYGTYTDPLIKQLQTIGVKTARTTISGLEPDPSYDLYTLKYIDVTQGLSYVKNQIDSAVDSESTIILAIHGIGSTPQDYVISTSDFQEIVDYVYQKASENSLEVTTISKLYNSLN